MELFASEPELPARFFGSRQEDANLVHLPLPTLGGPAREGMTIAQVARLFGYRRPAAPPAPPEPAPAPAPAPRRKPVHPRPAVTRAPSPSASRFRHTGRPPARPSHRTAPTTPTRNEAIRRPGSRIHDALARATSALLVLSLMLGWAVLALTIAQHVWGYNSYVVLSGSMRPTMPVGTLVLDQPVPASQIAIGDVVSVHPTGNPNLLVTHRVVRIQQDPPGARPGLYAKTKGDANPVEDSGWIPLAGRINRVAIWVPIAGYGVAALEQPGARVLLVLLPLALMATLALGAVWRAPR